MKKYLINLVVTTAILFTTVVYAESKTDFTQQISMVNINQADIKQLTSLKGVGEKKAQAIIEYRNTNGSFSSVDELLLIKGIGKQVIADNKPKLIL